MDPTTPRKHLSRSLRKPARLRTPAAHTRLPLPAPAWLPSSSSPISPLLAFSLQLLPSSAPPRSPPPPPRLPAPSAAAAAAAADHHLRSLGRWVQRLPQPPRPPPPPPIPIPIVSPSTLPSTSPTTMAHETGRSSRLGGPCGEPAELGGAVGPCLGRGGGGGHARGVRDSSADGIKCTILCVGPPAHIHSLRPRVTRGWGLGGRQGRQELELSSSPAPTLGCFVSRRVTAGRALALC